MDKKLRRTWVLVSLVLAMLSLVALPARAEGVLDKVAKSGQLAIGHREDAPPFAYYDKSGQWQGFSVEMGARLAEELGKKLGRAVEVVKKPVNSKTRIPLVANGELDIVIGTTTITLAREEAVDFSLPFFITGARILVPKGSAIKDLADLAGKRVGAAQGTTHVKNLEKAVAQGKIKPGCEILQFEDHAKGFLGLSQHKVDAYVTDESILYGLKRKAPKPEDWAIVGSYLSYEPYGLILPNNDSPWRDFVNAFLVRMYKSGEFEALYDKWMGPKSEVPMPMSEDFKTYLRVVGFPE